MVLFMLEFYNRFKICYLMNFLNKNEINMIYNNIKVIFYIIIIFSIQIVYKIRLFFVDF